MAVIQYSRVIDRQLLPVDAQDVVTRVRLVVAGDVAGDIAEVHQATSAPDGGETRPYAPIPIVHEYTAPEHSVYNATRAFALPSGVNPFLPPTAPEIPEPTVSGFDNPGSPSVVRDGDPLTSADWLLGVGSTGFITYGSVAGHRMHGFRLMYTLQQDGVGGVYPGLGTHVRVRVGDRFAVGGDPDSGTVRAFAVSPALTPVELPTELYGVAPEASFTALGNRNGTVVVPFGATAVELRVDMNVSAMQVIHFYPLMLDEVLLEDIARAQIRLPAQLPQRVTVRGYVSPDREHTIVGWPGGDYTGVVAQHQYELGRTIIDFEQAGSPAGLPAEAIEAARERKQAIDGTVAVANYNLMMGSRR